MYAANLQGEEKSEQEANCCWWFVPVAAAVMLAFRRRGGFSHIVGKERRSRPSTELPEPAEKLTSGRAW